MRRIKVTARFAGFFSALALSLASCATGATSAEEYYAIGMAYYELGKFSEAEKWFNKAGSLKKTMNASEYNLGRIAYETKRYDDAARHFERLLKLDPSHLMALKAAAYTEIMRGNLEKADEYYARVLALAPESADEGYNHALVLYAMKRYEAAEKTLMEFNHDIRENKDTLLLLARIQRAQKKVEAIDSYALWLNANSDGLVRYEYMSALEAAGYYTRAIEAGRKALDELSSDTESLKRSTLRFELGKLILIADPENEAGLTELRGAVEAGFADISALEALTKHEKITAANKTEIQNLIAGIKEKAAESK